MNRETMLEELRLPDPVARRRAALGLRQWNDAEVSRALAGALRDQDPDVQEAASDALLAIGDQQTIPLLLPLLQSDVPSIRNAAGTLLEKLGRIDPGALIDLSLHPDLRMRIFSANIMAGTGDHDTSPRLIEMTEDPEENVRDAAVVALGRLRVPEAIPCITKVLSQGSVWCRFSAIDALGKIGGPAAIQALLEYLPRADQALRDPLLETLGQLRVAGAIDPLVPLLAGSPKDRDTVCRLFLGPLFEEVRRRGADPFLVPYAQALIQGLTQKRLNSSQSVRALEYLSTREDTGATAAVLAALEVPHPAVRAAAARAAAALRIVEAIPPLQKLVSRLPSQDSAELRSALSRLESTKEGRDA